MHCRKTQAAFDACVKDNMGLDRPHYAYHTMAKIHDTTRYVKIVIGMNFMGW